MIRILAVFGLLLAPTLAQLDWRQSRLGRNGVQAAMDPIRNRLVGWSPGFSGVPGRVMEWDGRYFTHPSPNGAPQMAGKIAWDPVQGRMLLLSVLNIAPANTTQTWAWDGQAWTRLFPATNPPALDVGEFATDFARGKVVLFAGWGSVPTQTWEWDGANWQQRFPATMPSPRVDFAMAWHSGRGLVTLHGGTNGNPLGDTWEWDGTNWTQRATSGPVRRGHGFGATPDGNLVLFGGVANNVGPALSQTWVWNGNSWMQRLPAHAPPATVYPRMGLDTARGVTIALATVEIGAGELWEWDGQDWLQRSGGFPVQDQAAALAADLQRGRVVGFGWYGYTPLTWEWDGSEWRRFSVLGPSYRQRMAMAYSGSGEVVLFGGENPQQGAMYSDTWRWNGAQWSLVQTPTSPGQRKEHAMAYDELRGEVVLFGGRVAGNSFAVNDTWIWNGTTWSQRFPATNAIGRAEHGMAYDRARGVVVMYGGGNYGSATTDTWEWDGTNWSLVSLGGGPPALIQPMLASAPDGQGIVLYDRDASGGTSQRLWRWDGLAWTQIPFASWKPRNTCYGTYDPVHGHVVMLADSDAWLLEAPGAAEATRFGIGCPGTAGRPRLSVDFAWPSVGSAVDLRLDRIPTNALTLFALGTSDTSSGALSLPQELGASGMPDCWLYASVEGLVMRAASGGSAMLTVPIPAWPSLLGYRWFAQAAALDASANAAGLVTSNGVRLRVGP